MPWYMKTDKFVKRTVLVDYSTAISHGCTTGKNVVAGLQESVTFENTYM